MRIRERSLTLLQSRAYSKCYASSKILSFALIQNFSNSLILDKKINIPPPSQVRFSFAFPSLLVRSLVEGRMGVKWDLQRTCNGLTWEVHINELWKVSFLFRLINEKILLKLYDYHLFAVTLQKINEISQAQFHRLGG